MMMTLLIGFGVLVVVVAVGSIIVELCGFENIVGLTLLLLGSWIMGSIVVGLLR